MTGRLFRRTQSQVLRLIGLRRTYAQPPDPLSGTPFLHSATQNNEQLTRDGQDYAGTTAYRYGPLTDQKEVDMFGFPNSKAKIYSQGGGVSRSATGRHRCGEHRVRSRQC